MVRARWLPPHWSALASWLVAASLIASALGTPAPGALGHTPDLEGLIRHHYAALAAGDVAAVLATFTDDAVLRRGVHCPPAAPCVGLADIQIQIEQEIALELAFTVGDVRVTGNTATARLAERGSPMQWAGVERVLFEATYSFAGEKIARNVHDFDFADAQTAAFLFHQIMSPPTGSHAANTVGRVGSLFSEDGVLRGFGRCAQTPCVGRSAIREEIARAVEDRLSLTAIPGSGVASENRFTVQLEIRADSIQAAGIERVIAWVQTEVTDGMVGSAGIAALSVLLDEQDSQTARYLAQQGDE
jgi:ketosteroid isomerase-like protein